MKCRSSGHSDSENLQDREEEKGEDPSILAPLALL